MTKNYESKFHLVKWLLWMTLAGIATYRLINLITPNEVIEKKVYVRDTTNKNAFSEANLRYFMWILDIKYPEIVLNQAKLETGHFTASRFKNYNALFGFQTSESNICKYNTWRESVIAYKAFQMKKYREGEDYYKFLKRVKYASDSNYVKKLKSM